MSFAKSVKRVFQRPALDEPVVQTVFEQDVVKTAEPASNSSWSERLTFSHPERYTKNLPKYVARNGIIQFEADVERFRHNDLTRFYSFCLIIDQLVKEGIEGDLAEMGVWKGNSAALLATVTRRLGRTLYLLDTFEGFPEGDLARDEKQLVGAFSDTSLEAVRALVGDESTVFIKGYFPATAEHIPDSARFALVHIDCDLEAPMRSALEFFYPRMSPGGFIIMHDYSSLYWDGAENAIDGFFADKPECVMPLPDMGGSAVVRKLRR